MLVALTTVMPVAEVAPNLTAVAPVKPVPVMVTAVPPAAGPLVGLTAVTVGPALAGVQVRVKNAEELECAAVASLLALPPAVYVKLESA